MLLLLVDVPASEARWLLTLLLHDGGRHRSQWLAGRRRQQTVSVG